MMQGRQEDFSIGKQEYSAQTMSLSSSLTSNLGSSDEFVQIMHIDIDGSAKVGSKLSPYEITALVIRIYSKLSKEFLEKGALTFFIGGDNFMIISNERDKRKC